MSLRGIVDSGRELALTLGQVVRDARERMPSGHPRVLVYWIGQSGDLVAGPPNPWVWGIVGKNSAAPIAPEDLSAQFHKTSGAVAAVVVLPQSGAGPLPSDPTALPVLAGMLTVLSKVGAPDVPVLNRVVLWRNGYTLEQGHRECLAHYVDGIDHECTMTGPEYRDEMDALVPFPTDGNEASYE